MDGFLVISMHFQCKDLFFLLGFGPLEFSGTKKSEKQTFHHPKVQVSFRRIATLT